jgi:hypothetical protein
LRAELIERGYEVIGFAGVSEALGALRQGLYGRPMLIILELRYPPFTSWELRKRPGGFLMD